MHIYHMTRARKPWLKKQQSLYYKITKLKTTEQVEHFGQNGRPKQSVLEIQRKKQKMEITFCRDKQRVITREQMVDIEDKDQ